MKKFLAAALAGAMMVGLLTGIFAAPAMAEDEPKDKGLSDEQRGAISQNCGSIRQSLETLQRSDARTRVYLGAIYQAVLMNYMTPLNLRLVKNNMANAELSGSQASFSGARDDFVQKYITYSQSLEELLQVDCTSRPEEFYDKLTETREKRAELSKTTVKLKRLLDAHVESVGKLKEGS